MEPISFELANETADNLTIICFIAHSLQRMIEANAVKDSPEDLVVAADLLQEVAEKSLKALRKAL